MFKKSENIGFWIPPKLLIAYRVHNYYPVNSTGTISYYKSLQPVMNEFSHHIASKFYGGSEKTRKNVNAKKLTKLQDITHTH